MMIYTLSHVCLHYPQVIWMRMLPEIKRVAYGNDEVSFTVIAHADDDFYFIYMYIRVLSVVVTDRRGQT